MNRRFVPSILLTIAVLVLAGATLAAALSSLLWPLVHDLSIMLYEGFLVADLGMAPYRDFFDMNPPGTIAIYAMIHSITDGCDLALRIVDLGTIMTIAGLTFFALRRSGWRAGMLASSCFAIAYLSGGPTQALQREIFCVLLLALSAALLSVRRFRGMNSILLLTGFCAGAAVSIKPPIILLWLPLLLGSLYPVSGLNGSFRDKYIAPLFRALFFFSIGVVLLLSIVLLWLVQQGSLVEYYNIITQYYPLYTQISGSGMVYNHGVATMIKRYVMQTLPLLYSIPLLLVMTFVGIRSACESGNTRGKLQALTLLVLVCAALVYVPISGKFWFYHSIPLFYAMSLCAGLSATMPLSQQGRLGHSLLVLMLVCGLILIPMRQLVTEYRMWKQGGRHSVRVDTVEAMATYLNNHAKPHDTILPLDVTDGAIHVLYKLRRPLHGRFIYDLHFYHHVADPYIYSLRQEFLSTVATRPPDFVIQFKSWRPHGRSCSDDFPELELFLGNYSVSMQTNGASIMRRTLKNEVD